MPALMDQFGKGEVCHGCVQSGGKRRGSKKASKKLSKKASKKSSKRSLKRTSKKTSKRSSKKASKKTSKKSSKKTLKRTSKKTSKKRSSKKQAGGAGLPTKLGGMQEIRKVLATLDSSLTKTSVLMSVSSVLYDKYNGDTKKATDAIKKDIAEFKKLYKEAVAKSNSPDALKKKADKKARKMAKKAKKLAKEQSSSSSEKSETAESD